MSLRTLTICVALLFGGLAAGSGQAQEHASEIDFNRDIRPILAKRCFACHGPDKSEGGLRFTKREAALAKLESGEHAIVPGQVEASVLVARVTSKDMDERMPPEGAPLTVTQVGLLKRWIADGAKWEEHWAFVPPKKHAPPAVKDAAWVRTPIDAFVLAKLEKAGIKPSLPADKVALLRRAYYDLTGLPPSPADIDAFLADSSDAAYERLIDRLLDSPQYGERWARHWLDVVRYAETNSFERDGKKPHVWRYRDYVIRSFNADKPYDQFLREQLAGDEIPDAGNEGLIATAFLRLGLWDDEPADRLLAKYDVLDDVVSTTSQAFLGITVNCARCHDHKIDPIPQKEYYQMLSFFHGLTNNGTTGPQVERPLMGNDKEREEYQAALKTLVEKRNKAQAALTALENEFRTAADKEGVEKVGDSDLDDLEFRFYRDHFDRLPDFDQIKAETVGKVPSQRFDITLATRESDFGFVFTGVLKVPADGEYTFYLDSDDGSRLKIDGNTVIEYDGVHGEGMPREKKVALKAGRLPVRLDYFQGVGGQGVTISWSGPGVKRRFLSAEAGKTAANDGMRIAELIRRRGAKLLGEAKVAEYKRLAGRLDELKRDQPAVEMAYAATENGRQAPDTFVFRRGMPQSPADKVEPGFPGVFGGGKAVIPEMPKGVNSSGRRTALANWITAPDNPSTSRVMVNRIWQNHFGRGIVRSSNNFGLLGDNPTHLELLDWLAEQFVAGGFKQKPLHKLIMLSNTYRQSSRGREDALAKDPINNLFWRFDPRRLSAEEVRDSMHAVTGELNLKMFGPSYYPDLSAEVLASQSAPGSGWGKSSPEEQARRSIYIHVKRSLITPLLADFDFADTDASCPVRFATTIPTQALGLLNGSFTHERAEKLAARLKREAGDDRDAQIRLAWKLTTGRTPDDASLARGKELIEKLQKQHGQNLEQAMKFYCLTVLNLNEFVYLD